MPSNTLHAPELNRESLQISSIQFALLEWFAENERDFPWRGTQNPYGILVAEKLLQQTAARGVVVAVYQDLLKAYPTPIELAQAKHADLLEMIKPLGFHFRAHELISMAATIVDQYSGSVPQTLSELKSLPGVGEYTARAILSFAFGENVAVVDTNVARWLHRMLGIERPLPSNPARDRRLIFLASDLLPLGRSRDFNLAVLDLCALICVSGLPSCNSCPLLRLCAFSASSLPRKDQL